MIQASYRRDEWDLILGAPGLIALVMIETEQWSQTIAYWKLRALMSAIEEATDIGPEGGLIQAVCDAVRAGQSPLWPTECPRDLTNICAWALSACRQLAAILAQKAPESEAEAYTHWLMGIAQRMTLAPHENGPDHHERDARQQGTLAALAAALDAQPGYVEAQAAAKA